MEGSRVQSNNREPATGSVPSFLRPTPPPPPPRDNATTNDMGLIYPGDHIILPMWLKIMLISGILVFFLSSILGSIYTLSFIGSNNYDYEDRAFWGVIISTVFQIGLFLMAFASFFTSFIKKDMDMRVRKGFLIAFILFMLLLSYSSWGIMMGML